MSSPAPVVTFRSNSPVATKGEISFRLSLLDPSLSFVPVSMTTWAKFLNVTFSKATPPLVPEIRFCPAAGLSIVMRSSPPPVEGVVNVNVPVAKLAVPAVALPPS